MDSNLLVYLDGEFVPQNEAKVSVFDHGFLYGDGVFEGIRAYSGKIFRLAEHVDRIYDSAKTIDLEIPITKEEMSKAIIETCKRNNLIDCYIRPVVSRGPGDLGLDPRKCPKPTVVVIAVEWGAMYGDLYEKGLTGVFVSVRRIPAEAMPPNVKSLNYLNNILGKIEATYKGGDEAIFFDTNGYLSEGAGDNIFIIKNGTIVTPPTLNNLRGITRAVAFEMAASLGIEVIERNAGYFDLYSADEIFVTGTAAEIAPVTTVDGRKIGPGVPGPITRQFMEMFQAIVRREGTPIQ
jgi:branched-chain amino acid aminotransferase